MVVLVGRRGPAHRARVAGPGAVGGGPAVEAETAALAARFTVDPGEARLDLIDDCIRALKAAGVWAKLDALYLPAAHDAQAAQCNWIQDAFNLTPVGEVTFTVDRGYTGDGASGYLDTGFNDLTGSALWSQDAMAAGVYVNIWAGGLNYALGLTGGANVRLGATTSAINTRAHSASYNPTFADALPGHIVIVRDGPSSLRCFRNGAQVGSTTALPSSTPINSNVAAFRSMSAYSADRVACLHLGGALTPAEGADLHAAVVAYLTAIGAN